MEAPCYSHYVLFLLFSRLLLPLLTVISETETTASMGLLASSSGFQSVDLGGSSTARPAARSLMSFPSPSSSLQPDDSSTSSTELVALLNGTIYLEDTSSGQVFWSFSSGPPIYSSYQAPSLYDDAAAASDAFSTAPAFFVDYGDDWHLYAHFKHSGGMKLSTNIEDFIKITPHISEDGALILGSKKTTVFVLNAKTGKLLRTYHSPDSMPSILHARDEPANAQDRKDAVVSGLSFTGQVIYLTRTDYALQTFAPNSDKVCWNVKVAVVEASFLCNDVDASAPTFNSSYEVNSDPASDFDRLLSCQPRRMAVRRQKKPHSSSEAIRSDDKKLPLPTSNLMLPSQPTDERMLLPGSAPNPAMPSHSKVDAISNFHPNNDGEVMLTLPGDPMVVDIQEVGLLYTGILSIFFKLSTAFPFMLIVSVALLGFVSYHCSILGKEKSASDGKFSTSSKAPSSKRKRSQKLGMNSSVETKVNTITSENGDGLTSSEGDHDRFLDLNKLIDCGASGHRIGKLLLSTTEIAKGSNGTIVLEGAYEGRPVAVKRLVRAHHDVAFKEIQNLIASDRHPNIVRWYGVEFDKDFVYLSLERCTCSLDDLIQIFSDSSLNPTLGIDQADRTTIECKLKLELLKDVMRDFNFWKSNGHPSPLLLTLMRDMVSGLAHLHELGIVHRDLKPQNVLIVKDRSLCAKLSDMGISKRLLGDMSSLGHHATGCGSSGWQAPEQLLHGRQTRAVDLFSLGCVLFFCITRGKHPFGDCLERDINIVKNQMDLFLVENIPEAEDLISGLLNPDPELRPKAREVLHHPLFWSSETRLSFLRDTSDRVELEDRESSSDLLKALENIAPTALGGKWDGKMEAAFITNIGHYRRYKFDSVRDLLRVMRNKLNHYRELPSEIQELVGPVPEGYDGYFAKRFPKLLIEVYKVVCRYCKEEECFQKYYKGSIL